MNKKHKWTEEQIKNFWDYESQFPDNYWGRNCAAGFCKFFREDLREANLIVDMGCGDGALIGELLKRVKGKKKFFGIEPSEESIKKVDRICGGAENFGGVFSSVDGYLRNNESPDLVIVTEVIEHLYDIPLEKLLFEIKKLCQKKTKIIFTTPNSEKLEDSYIMNPIDGSLFHRWQHVRSWDRNNISDKLLEMDFQVLACDETNILWYNSNLLKNFYRRLRFRNQTSLFVRAMLK